MTAGDPPLEFSVTGTDQYGNAVADLGTITWTSSFGAITASGLTTADFESTVAGSGTVTATSGSISDTSGTIIVGPGDPTQLMFKEYDDQPEAGETQKFEVTGVDDFGNVVTELGTILWSVNGDIGTIDENGNFTAEHANTGTVTAYSQTYDVGATSGTITVGPGPLAKLIVSPDIIELTTDVNDQQFEVAGYDAYDNLLTSLEGVKWSGGTGIGSIDEDSGIFNATTVGVGTVTAAVGAISDTSGNITVTHGVPARIELSSNKPEVTFGGQDPVELTATFLDTDNNLVESEAGTTVTFTPTGGGAQYVVIDPNTDLTDGGTATVTLNTTDPAEPPDEINVDIQATGGEFTSNTVTLKIVNFYAKADFDDLLTVGTPHQAIITAKGATSYTWAQISGNGELTSNGSTATFVAPDAITEGTAGHPTVIRVKDASNPQRFFDLTIKTFEPVQVVAPAAAVGITRNDTGATYQVQVSGGSGNYAYAVVDGSTDVISVNENGLVTGLATGTKSVYVWDNLKGNQATDNSFRAQTALIEVIDAVQITPIADDALASGASHTFVATGGKIDGQVDWEATAGTIDAAGEFTAPVVATGSQKVTITAYDKTYNKAHVTPIKAEYEVTVFGTLAVSPNYSIGIVQNGTQVFTVAGGNADGGINTWSLVENTPVTAGQDVGQIVANDPTTTATFTALNLGTVKVKATDSKNFEAFSGTIEVVNPIAIGGPASVESGKEASFTAEGGKGSPYTWEASDGTIDENGKFTAPALESGTLDVTITASDKTYPNLKDEHVVTVYGSVAFLQQPADYDPNNPLTYPLMTFGTTFTLSASDSGSYNWTVLDRLGTAVASSTAASDSFDVDPDYLLENFGAGVYTLNAEDSGLGSRTGQLKIRVPFKLDPSSKVFTETKLDGAANPQAFTVLGADSDYTWEILDSKTATAEVTTPGDYGTWAKASPVASDASNSLTPADVDVVKRFFIRVTVENDDGLTEDNELNQRVFGPFALIPVATFTVTVADEAGAAVQGAEVSVDYIDPDTDAKVAAGTTNIDGQAGFVLPDAGGTYKYTAQADGYVSATTAATAKAVSLTLRRPARIRSAGA